MFNKGKQNFPLGKLHYANAYLNKIEIKYILIAQSAAN